MSWIVRYRESLHQHRIMKLEYGFLVFALRHSRFESHMTKYFSAILRAAASLSAME